MSLSCLVLAIILDGSTRAVGAEPYFNGLQLRGINVTQRVNITPYDLSEIRQWGANSIRLVLHADPAKPKHDGLIQSLEPMVFDDSGFERLRKTLDLAQAENLAVVIDLHSWPWRKNGLLWTDFAHWDDLIQLWVEIAKRYGNHPAIVGYDLMNEPNWLNDTDHWPSRNRLKRGDWAPPAEWIGTPRDYNLLMKRLTAAIREVDPVTTIIVEGAGVFGHPNNLSWLEPTGDPNTAYSFHMYFPNQWTHVNKGLDDDAATDDLPSYPMPGIGKDRVYAHMEAAVEFSRRHSAPIYVGEFSPIRWNEGHGAGQWMEDVLQFFEANGWHWAYWTYTWPDRSPKYGFDGEVSAHTERLMVLKKYWELN